MNVFTATPGKNMESLFLENVHAAEHKKTKNKTPPTTNHRYDTNNFI